MTMKSKFDINTMLMVFGFVVLLIGFFLSPKSIIGFHFYETDLMFSKTLLLRTVGLMSVLNGLIFKFIEAGAYKINIRWKNLSIVLFFLSIVIIGMFNLLEWTITADKQVTESVKDLGSSSFLFVLAESMILAGMATLMISLLMPLLIWTFGFVKNRKSQGCN